MDILKRALEIKDNIVSWRRQIHQYPELQLDTPKTAEFVVKVLSGLGVDIRTNVGGDGVAAVLKGNGGSSKTFAIRADMDGLPVTEETGLSFASKIPGMMHACGHDAHVAMALGAATILSQIKHRLNGNVKFIFQPGEEGGGGARLMIEDGVLQDPKVDAIVGGHVGSLWPVGLGVVGVKEGPLMAASDSFTLTIRGKGGHGAAPEQSVDPIVVAAQIALVLQTIVSRDVSPVTPAVVTIGTIQAGTASNIIPDFCVMRGTVRYIDAEMAEFIPRRIREIAEGVAHGMRAKAELSYKRGYPPLINDPKMTALVRRSASQILGSEKVHTLKDPTMGGEDMAYYLQKVPGTFFALGSSDRNAEIVYPNHHPKFDVDESVLPLGAAVFCQSAIDYLDTVKE